MKRRTFLKGVVGGAISIAFPLHSIKAMPAPVPEVDDFMRSREIARNEIAKTFGLPPSYIGGAIIMTEGPPQHLNCRCATAAMDFKRRHRAEKR